MKWFYCLRAAAVGALVLFGAELLLRQADWFDPTVLADPYHGLPGSSPVYRRENRGDVPIYKTSPNRRDRYRDVEFSAQKDPRELRVFCMGGSSVVSERFIQPDCAFPSLLQVYLRALYQPRQARVINSGGAGTGSLQNLEVVREVVEYGADLLVLYPEGGEKNLIPPAPAGVLALGDTQNPLRVQARKLFATWRVYCAVRQGFRALLPQHNANWMRSAFSALVQQALAEPFSERTFTRMFELKQDRPPVLMERVISQADVDFANARFLQSLRAVADVCSAKQVQLALVLPVHNLDYSFYLKFHIDPSEIRPGQIDAWRERYARGLEFKRAGDPASALPVLQSIRELYFEDKDDILGFYIAQCHAALGQQSERMRELLAIYRRHPMLGQIRQVAAEKNVLLVDPLPALIEAAGGGVPSDDFFIDAFHPTPKTNHVIARAIVNALAAAAPAGNFRSFDDPRAAEAEAMIIEMSGVTPLPTNCFVRKAMAAKDYESAVRIARSAPDVTSLNNSVDPFYLGWALTRAGQVADAEKLYQRMRERWHVDSLHMPDMSTDEGLIRYAFQGDVFAIF